MSCQTQETSIGSVISDGMRFSWSSSSSPADSSFCRLPSFFALRDAFLLLPSDLKNESQRILNDNRYSYRRGGELFSTNSSSTPSTSSTSWATARRFFVTPVFVTVFFLVFSWWDVSDSWTSLFATSPRTGFCEGGGCQYAKTFCKAKAQKITLVGWCGTFVPRAIYHSSGRKTWLVRSESLSERKRSRGSLGFPW